MKLEFPHPPFRIHRSVARFCLPLSRFAKLPSNAGKTLVVGALIARPTSPTTHGRRADLTNSTDSTDSEDDARTRILLLQRSSSSSSSTAEPAHLCPNQWEIPSGQATFGTDQTLLEAVVRRVKEETGLRVSAVRAEFEGFEYVCDGSQGVCKQYNFVVEVALETEAGAGAGAGFTTDTRVRKQGAEGHCVDGNEMEEEVQITLSPEEHQAYRWVTEDQVDRLEMSEAMRKVIRDGFKALEAEAKRQAGKRKEANADALKTKNRAAAVIPS